MDQPISKNNKITVCIFGKKIETLFSEKNAPEYEENTFQLLNYDNDHQLNDIIKKYDPHVYITFDDWQKYKLLCNASI